MKKRKILTNILFIGRMLLQGAGCDVSAYEYVP